jgi:hypothetical protein
MSLSTYINSLVAEHKALDTAIEHMESASKVDSDSLRQLKKKKLALKDQIVKLRSAKAGVKQIKKESE